MSEHIKQLEEFAREVLGIDLSKWELTFDNTTDAYSDENECREIGYDNKQDPMYRIYVVMEHFDPPKWEIIEFNMEGD